MNKSITSQTSGTLDSDDYPYDPDDPKAVAERGGGQSAPALTCRRPHDRVCRRAHHRAIVGPGGARIGHHEKGHGTVEITGRREL